MKITVLSGFLGAGKTTLLNKLLPALEEDLVVVENEFGEVSVDGGRIGAQIPVHEINAGCICCSLADDFQGTIGQIGIEKQNAHILIEPSGVGKLSDVVKACNVAAEKKMLPLEGLLLITVVDIVAFESDLQDFGDFYLDQITNADLILCSYVADVSEQAKKTALKKIRAINSRALIYEEDWYEKDGQELERFCG